MGREAMRRPYPPRPNREKNRISAIADGNREHPVRIGVNAVVPEVSVNHHGILGHWLDRDEFARHRVDLLQCQIATDRLCSVQCSEGDHHELIACGARGSEPVDRLEPLFSAPVDKPERVLRGRSLHPWQSGCYIPSTDRGRIAEKFYPERGVM